MENGTTKIKMQKDPVERIAVRNVALQTLNGWVDQLGEQVQGIKISRTELVEWLIQKHQKTLSADEVASIKNQYFDDVQLAVWALKKLRAARSEGKPLTLAEVISSDSGQTKSRAHKSTAEKGVLDGDEL